MVSKSKFPMADCCLNGWCPSERDLINILLPNANIDSQFSELVKLYSFRGVEKEVIQQMVESVYQSQGSNDIDSLSPFGGPGIWSTMATHEVPGAGCSINQLIGENLGTAFASEQSGVDGEKKEKLGEDDEETAEPKERIDVRVSTQINQGHGRKEKEMETTKEFEED